MSSNPPPPGPPSPGWGERPPRPPDGVTPPYAGRPVPAQPEPDDGQLPPHGSYGSQPYDPSGPGGPPAQPPYPQTSPPPRRRGPKILAVVAALTMLFGAGAFAFYETDPMHLFTPGPQAAEALPGDALFYLGVDADPSAKQKLDAVRFLNHFPYFKEHAGLADENSDVRQTVVQKAIDASGCSGVTYGATVKPWLGKKFGLALMPGAGAATSPDAVIAVEVTDQGQAKSGLADIAACSDQAGGNEFGYAFEGDYAVLAETQELADGYADDAATSSLADNDDFNADMDSLGELGVATMWVDIDAALSTYGDSVSGDSLSPENLDTLKKAYQRAAATFRFSSDHLEIAASVFGATTDVTHQDNQIVNLPDSTVFAMSEAGGAERLKASWDDVVNSISSNGVDVEQEIAQFEAQTGLTLPDDLETIFGDNLMLAVDGNGLTADNLQSGDSSQLNLGVRFTSDPAQLSALYDKITSLIQDQGGQDLPISRVDASDGLAIATNDSYAKTLAGLGGGLGGSDAFTSVIQDAASKEFVLFFNWDEIESQVVEALQSDGGSTAQTQQVVDNITPLRAVGITSETDGDYTVSVLSLSVND